MDVENTLIRSEDHLIIILDVTCMNIADIDGYLTRNTFKVLSVAFAVITVAFTAYSEVEVLI